MAHIGSWGLPDFGITEGINRLLGGYTNRQGGSELYLRSPSSQEYQSKITQPEAASYNRAYNTIPNPATYRKAYNVTTPSPAGGGSSGGGGGGGQNAYQAPSVDPLFAEIDSIYNEGTSLLGTAESNLRGQQPGIEQDIRGRAATSAQEVENQRLSGEREIASGETQAGQVKENALSSARRLFNETQMGGQQRFGGASSAGQAYSEINAREMQRNMGNAVTAFQNTIMKFGEIKANLMDKINLAKQKIEMETSTALNEAKRVFDNKLLEIQNLRVGLSENRGQMRLSALQDLRNQIYQINLAKVQNAQTIADYENGLGMVEQSLQDEYNRSVGQSQQVGNAFASNLSGGYQSTNPVAALNSSVPSAYTGSIRKDEEFA